MRVIFIPQVDVRTYQWFNLIMNKIVLIGGAPTVGKSYITRKLAEELKLPWVSTDTIREQMRKLVRKEDYPALFHHAEATPNMAVEFLTHNTVDEIIQHQNQESLEVWKGVSALVETDYVWRSFLVEGIAILPGLVSGLNDAKKEVEAVFLVDENEKRIRDVVFTRGLWDDADKYPDDVKEKEVEWVMAFNKWIKEEAKKYDFPVVEIGDRDSYIDKVKQLII